MAMPGNVFGQAAQKVLFPIMAQMQDDPQRLGIAFRRGFSLTAIALVPLSIFLLVLAPEIVQVLLGSQWSAVTPIFQVFALCMFFRGAYKISGMLANALGHVMRNAFHQFIYAFLVITGAIIGLHYNGLVGVAWGVSVALVLNFIQMTNHGLGLLKLRWMDILKEQSQTLTLSFILSIYFFIFANMSRSLNFSSFVIILSTLITSVILILLLIKVFPKFIIGEDIQWWINKFPQKSIPMLSRK
jgi:PST family polysaccharide transporter